jgi:metal-dependent amidase/aminoacylase/carboxypeptidase family protein
MICSISGINRGGIDTVRRQRGDSPDDREWEIALWRLARAADGFQQEACGPMGVQNLKEQAKLAIDEARDELVELSRRIQANPETAYQEVRAAWWVGDALEGHGFEVEHGLGGLETAFEASLKGKGSGPVIALIAEYDALPGVGHGCGHNLIAAGAVGAAVGLRSVMPQLDGRLRVFGTPAEECTFEPGGKIRLLERDALEGVDACLMFHPWTTTELVGSDLAVTTLEIDFRGKTAHAAADPWRGANALDRASALFAVRSVDKDYLEEVVSRVEDCAQGAALATGTSVTTKRLVTIENSLPNSVLAEVVKANMEAEGMEFEDSVFLPGSTDFGNLSQRVPAFWFMLETHRKGLNWHSKEVAEEAVSDDAHAAMLQGAKVLAMSCLDLFTDPGLVRRASQEFEDSRGGR